MPIPQTAVMRQHQMAGGIGANPDIYPFTPGLQLMQDIKSRFAAFSVSTRDPRLLRDIHGHINLFAVSPGAPESGVQSMPQGVQLSKFPKNQTVYGQLVTGELVPLRRTRRSMDVLNPKALVRALRRTAGAAEMCKRIIRADATNKKTFKSTKRRKKRK